MPWPLVIGLLCAPASIAPRPNILIVLADDLGYGDLEVYGQKFTRTPNTSRLAQEGIRFTQFYSGSTVCAPSRDCLMTGRDTGHAWMRGNGSICLRTDPEDLTFAKMLKSAGYETGLIGKSCVQCDSRDPMMPNMKGFDTFYGQLAHIDAHFHYPKVLYSNGVVVDLPGNDGYSGPSYDHDLFLREAKKFIAKPRKKPFLLVYAATLPHAGLTVPDRWKAPYVGRKKEKPFAGGHYNACPDPIATYAGMVSRLDWDLGQLMEALRARRQDKNTLVIFTSDNGGALEGGYHAPELDSNGGLRGTKRDLYEGGIRVPFIAKWPGHIPPGKVSSTIGAFWDLMPTLAGFGGGIVPKSIQGIDIGPAMKGAMMPDRPYLYWEFHEQGGKRSVRFGNWKAVQLDVDRSPNGLVEIYDLAIDRGEQNNLASQHPELVQRARALFIKARVPNPNFEFGKS